MKKFILIGHKKRQGKDTFAKMLKEELGNAEILSFADPMREIMAHVNGTTVNEYKEAYNEDDAMRTELKNFGNGKMIEYFGETVWRDLLIKRAEACDVKYIIVPDFRFKREFIEGSITIKVVRPSVEYKDAHQSETELDSWSWDYMLLNQNELLDLKEYATDLANIIKPKESKSTVPTTKAEFLKSYENYLTEMGVK